MLVPPFHTSKWSFVVGKTHGFVGETHHFRVHPHMDDMGFQSRKIWSWSLQRVKLHWRWLLLDKLIAFDLQAVNAIFITPSDEEIHLSRRWLCSKFPFLLVRFLVVLVRYPKVFLFFFDGCKEYRAFWRGESRPTQSGNGVFGRSKVDQ